MKNQRLNLAETWDELEAGGLEMPRHTDGSPFIPPRIPRHDDDEPLGFAYFKEGIVDGDFSFLTLPRTFFGRSRFERITYVGTDLAESRVCWNEFIECNFTDADLSHCDIRASIFTRCHFTGATMKGVDLRYSQFTDWDFSGANLSGAKATALQAAELKLSVEQSGMIQWKKSGGSYPPGG